MRYRESGTFSAAVFVVSVPVMLYQTGLRVTVMVVDDLDPGTVVVRDRGLVRIARADCGSLSSLLSVLRLAGGLIRWHALSDATRSVLQREAERIRVRGDARAAFYQATDAEMIVGRSLCDEGADDPDGDQIMRELRRPEILRWGWFFGPTCFAVLLPLQYIVSAKKQLERAR